MLCIPPVEDIVLFLDIDGTLLDFAATPSDVLISEALIDTLIDVRMVLDDALAFVSGRMLEDVDNLFSPLQMPGGFSHGGELRYPDFHIERSLADSQRVASVFERAVAWARHRHSGILVENKGDALALHYRQAQTESLAVQQYAESLLSELGEDYHVLPGHAVIEIKPRYRSKGHAICRLLQFPKWMHRIPVFLGDDVTDEDGFKFVNAVGGVSVKIGQGETQATFCLPGPQAVHQWLRSLV